MKALNARVGLGVLFSALVASGCASTPELKTEPIEQVDQIKMAAASASDAASATEAGPLVGSADDKIQQLAKKVEELSAQLDQLRSQLAARGANDPHLASAKPHPADGVGEPVKAARAKNDPDGAFIQDDAIGVYRNAMILFEAKKYSEAILAFSDFLKNYADHPLAGGAQFFIGEAYYFQNEHKLALSEYKRVLIAYDRSSYLPDALRRAAECAEKTQLDNESADYRQHLLTLFPQSPAARMLTNPGESQEEREVASSTQLITDEAPPPDGAPVPEKE